MAERTLFSLALLLCLQSLGSTAEPSPPQRLILAHRMIGFGPHFRGEAKTPYGFLFPVKEAHGPDVAGWCREGHIGALHPSFVDQVEELKWEIGQAMEAGVDGFVLDICGGTHEFGIPDNMLKAAEELGGAFKVGLCLDYGYGGTDMKVACVKEWMERHAGSPAQLRLKGLPAFITYGSGYAILTKADEVRDRIGALRDAAGQPIYVCVDMTEFPNLKPEEWEPKVRPYAPYADGITCFFSRQRFERNAQAFSAMAKVCHESGKDWAMSLWGNYYTPGRTANLENLGADNSRLWDRMWKVARDTRADYVQLVTWNDITEDTTIMPGLRRHFTFADLLEHYYGPWYRTGVEPKPTRDQVYVFYRPYRTDAHSPLVAGPHVHGSDSQDSVEVRSFLTAPGTVVVAGMGKEDVPAGMSSVEFPSRPGPVKVSLLRKGKEVLAFHAPEWITDRPWREDFALRGFSSEEPAHWAKWFGGAPGWISEYGDDDGNGLPNWFEHYYFAQWTGTDPNADPDGDGSANRQEYADGTDPRNPPAVYPSGYRWDAATDFRPKDETYPILDSLGAKVWEFQFLSRDERPGRFAAAGLLVQQLPAWLERGDSWSFGIGKPDAGSLSYFGEANSAASQVWTSPVSGRVALAIRVAPESGITPLSVRLTKGGAEQPVWQGTLEPNGEPLSLSRELQVNRGDRFRLTVAGRPDASRWSARVTWTSVFAG